MICVGSNLQLDRLVSLNSMSFNFLFVESMDSGQVKTSSSQTDARTIFETRKLFAIKIPITFAHHLQPHFVTYNDVDGRLGHSESYTSID